MKIAVNILAALYAVVAAVTWWQASRVYTPKSIFTAAPGDDPRDWKKYVGVHTPLAGSGEPPAGALPDLVRGVRTQSLLNKEAASWAAGAAILQAAAAVFFP